MNASNGGLPAPCDLLRYAVTDALSMLYYPFKPECYWWSIVLLARPTVIAICYNARNHDTGVRITPASDMFNIHCMMLLH
jgi:hypothetical protein